MSKYNNGSLERRIGIHFPKEENPNHTQSFYPNERYYEMLKGYAYESMESISKVGCRIFKQFFESLSEPEKQRYLRSAKNYKGRKRED